MKYILTENQFSDLLKKIMGLGKVEPKVEEVKNEIEKLEGKTVRLTRFVKGKKDYESSYLILNPSYDIVDTGKKIRAMISFNVKDLERAPIGYEFNLIERIMVDLKKGKVVMYGISKTDGDYNIVTYKNESLEKYIENLLDKFPIFWKEKEKIKTDF